MVEPDAPAPRALSQGAGRADLRRVDLESRQITTVLELEAKGDVSLATSASGRALAVADVVHEASTRQPVDLHVYTLRGTDLVETASLRAVLDDTLNDLAILETKGLVLLAGQKTFVWRYR